jgi:hypothetical protein
MNDYAADRADAQHPWIGLASFTEGDRAFFAGRNDEIDDLLRLVRRDTLTLLYGVSGLGKTSLVQAGLFPALREENVLPVPIRLDYLEGAQPLAHQIMNAIGVAAMAARVEAPLPRPNETLWEYFHREGNHFWSQRNDLVTPFLAFDQFEEFFTLGRETPARAARANGFIMEFADLVENRPPSALRGDPARAKGFNFKPVPVKVLLAMREDYLADLDRVRSHFRALGQNRLRLLPMGERQASQVIALGKPLLAPGVEERIIKYVAGATADAAEVTVAPALLSLVLRELNERRLARGPDAKITPDLLDVEQHKIFEDFYLRTLADFPPNVRLFIEDELLTASGHRNSAALDDALNWPNVTLPILNELVNRRLLAYEDRHHTRRVELTHDVLVPVIKASRDSRLTREALAQADRLRAEQIAQRRKQRLTLVLAGVLGLALIATIWGTYYFFIKEHRAYYSYFSKRKGFPVGIHPLSEGQARHLSVSFAFDYKGITREGWNFHWKPAHRMVAVNSELRPTTNHSVGTYLWTNNGASEGDDSEQSQRRIERLGLLTVCQWEFDANSNGEIIYERALNRDGRMVYGFIYSPPGSGPPDTRLARFVGPEGFPLLQRRSDAEYVSIHYDANGWEDRMTYSDGKNLPAAGPDGAYGQTRSYNAKGQVTRYLSIDADGMNMIDQAGNCGMELIYNDKGWLVEEHSLGADLKPLPVKDGWTILKSDVDDLGRTIRGTYYGLKGEPVLHRSGYHGWESRFDDHGNRVRLTYLGLDGKPALLADGYACEQSAFNADGKVTRWSYIGAKGEAVLHKQGYHTAELDYDKKGNEIARRYLGLDGKPTLVTEGYTSTKSVYDADGKLTRTSYFGLKGEGVLHKSGYHSWGTSDDPANKKSTTAYYGLDEKPILIPDGYASFEQKYDSDGNVLEAAYFDASGRPALDQKTAIHRILSTYDGRGKNTKKRFEGVDGGRILDKAGYHGWDAEYDARGNRTALKYIGTDEEPIVVPEGYAISRATYNAQGKHTQTSYYGLNGEPVLSKDGYHAWRTVYDERGNEVDESYFDTAGKPTLDRESQVHKVVMTYDEHGYLTRKRFLGLNNEPTLHKDGHHGWDAEYDERGNRTKQTYLGVDGRPMLFPDGYATLVSEYSPTGNVVRKSYYGVDGKKVNIKDGYHAAENAYDERGNKLAEAYFDTNGKPVPDRESGVHRVVIGHDTHGNVTGKRYRGTRDEAVLHSEGNHGWDAEYDERGNQVSITYLGLDEKPVLMPNHFATIRWVYDAAGRQTQMSLFGVKGEPVLHKDGHHGWTEKYDDRGRKAAFTHFGLDNKPILLPENYATIAWTYDARGRAVEQGYYGVSGEPVLFKKAYQGWTAEYDERGNVTLQTYLGVDRKPMVLNLGFCKVKKAYDLRGNLIRQTYHGVNTEPVLYNNEYHGWESQFDDHGNETGTTFLGLDGRPALVHNEFATIKQVFDARGRMVRLTYHGLNGQPVLHNKAYHGYALTYDANGKVTAKTYFGVDGKPVNYTEEKQTSNNP